MVHCVYLTHLSKVEKNRSICLQILSQIRFIRLRAKPSCSVLVVLWFYGMMAFGIHVIIIRSVLSTLTRDVHHALAQLAMHTVRREFKLMAPKSR